MGSFRGSFHEKNLPRLNGFRWPRSKSYGHCQEDQEVKLQQVPMVWPELMRSMAVFGCTLRIGHVLAPHSLSSSPKKIASTILFRNTEILMKWWWKYGGIKYHRCFCLNDKWSSKENRSFQFFIWVFPKIGVHEKWMVLMENPIKMDLGVPPFKETPIWSLWRFFCWGSHTLQSPRGWEDCQDHVLCRQKKKCSIFAGTWVRNICV